MVGPVVLGTAVGLVSGITTNPLSLSVWVGAPVILLLVILMIVVDQVNAGSERSASQASVPSSRAASEPSDDGRSVAAGADRPPALATGTDVQGRAEALGKLAPPIAVLAIVAVVAIVAVAPGFRHGPDGNDGSPKASLLPTPTPTPVGSACASFPPGAHHGRVSISYPRGRCQLGDNGPVEFQGTVDKTANEALTLITCMAMDGGSWGRDREAVKVRPDGSWSYEYFVDGRAAHRGTYTGFSICAVISLAKDAPQLVQPASTTVDLSKIRAHECVDDLTLHVLSGYKD